MYLYGGVTAVEAVEVLSDHDTLFEGMMDDE